MTAHVVRWYLTDSVREYYFTELAKLFDASPRTETKPDSGEGEDRIQRGCVTTGVGSLWFIAFIFFYPTR